MLAPIITKDMKLFPSRPLPANIKNVRSRAQSLDQFTEQQASQSLRGRIVPVKPRTSQSVGNLPIAAQKSPPKVSSTRKTTLTAIAEGVEMDTKEKQPGHGESSSGHTRKMSEKERLRQKLREKEKEKENGKAGSSKESAKESTSTSPKESPKGTKEKKGVVRWLTNALRSKPKPGPTDDAMSTNSS